MRNINIVILLLVFSSILTLHIVQSKHPIVLVNGLAGSVMRARISEKYKPPNRFCQRNSEWHTVWLSLKQLSPPFHACFIDILTPRFNLSSKEYFAPDGVELDTNFDFGGVEAVSFLDPAIKLPQFGYFNQLIHRLKKELNYSAGLDGDLHGAPYDWRMAPDGLTSYFFKLKNLIERSYVQNGNMSVILLTHSLGGPVSLAFLNTQPQKWKDIYIRAFLPLAGPFGGVPSIAESLTSGDNFGIPVIPMDYLYQIQVNSPSAIWLFPQPEIFGSNTVIVSTPSKNFTIGNLNELVDAIRNPEVSAFYEQVMRHSMEKFEAPNVDTYAFYGSKRDTEFEFTFPRDLGENKATKSPKVTKFIEGDGTVPVASAEVVNSWSADHEIRFKLKNINLGKKEHFSMLSDDEVLKTVVQTIREIVFSKTR